MTSRPQKVSREVSDEYGVIVEDQTSGRSLFIKGIEGTGLGSLDKIIWVLVTQLGSPLNKTDSDITKCRDRTTTGGFKSSWKGK